MSKRNVIMIVEDEAILQDVYKLVLTNAGHKVHTANNGKEALDQLTKIKPNLVLLDIFMPVLDGIGFLRALDKSAYPEMRVVVCSNLSDTKVQKEVAGLGADDYVLKASLGPAELLKLVESVNDSVSAT
ncbi:MAG TPA: response regulator [Candidatus Saccharimonadales bacterium]|nr:response regulator [Candidatus Saccharimonadales bacterium]